jgi:hypothetical protein
VAGQQAKLHIARDSSGATLTPARGRGGGDAALRPVAARGKQV